MSKGRQFQDLSTNMFKMTTPTWTIKLQSQTENQVMNYSQILIEFAEISCTSFFVVLYTLTKTKPNKLISWPFYHN